MNRQFGCAITASNDDLFHITNRYGDEYTYRIEQDGERFLIQNRVDDIWHTQAIRYSLEDAEVWLRYEYSEAEYVPTPQETCEHRQWLAKQDR